nr:prolyl aminopeptidase [Sphingomonas sp. Y57]
MDFSRLQRSSTIADEWRYPEAEPNRAGHLGVAEGHRLFWEEYGNPLGDPVMCLHGGPGAGCSPNMARFFDPARFRIILFDQRGCGKSTPNVAADGPDKALANNSTRHLIDDIAGLRAALGITGKMHVFGGSWGSTLAMAYGIAHPDHCASLILRGIFLGTPEDLRYLYQGNAETFETDPYALTAPGAYIHYPEAWRAFLSVLTPVERADVIKAYKRLFDMKPGTDAERKRQLNAARAWSLWEGTISNMIPDTGGVGKFGEDEFALCFAQIEAHYFANDLFLEPDHLLGNAAILARIPIHIVHGRFDQVCPLTQASRLVEALRHAGNGPASFTITHAGHSAVERDTALALTAIMDALPAIGAESGPTAGSDG